MNTMLIMIGIACIIGAIIGGGVKLVQVELSPVTSLWRQLLLGGFGIILVASGLISGGSLTGSGPADGSGYGRQPASSPGTTPAAGITAPPAGTQATPPDYIIADSQTRRLTASDMAGLSRWQLRIARDEIFARHGRRFRKPELASYFAKLKWYQPLHDEVTLSPLEQANVALIERYERAAG